MYLRSASSPRNLLMQVVNQKDPSHAKQHFSNVVGALENHKIISKIYQKM